MAVKKYHIYIHSEITPEHHEKLEDALVQVVRDFGLEGELNSDYTGNSIFIGIDMKPFPLRKDINEASMKYDKFGAVVFDKEKMLKLIDRDEFLYATWLDLYEDKSEEEKDRGLETMFNTYVLEDSVMEHKYEEV